MDKIAKSVCKLNGSSVDYLFSFLMEACPLQVAWQLSVRFPLKFTDSNIIKVGVLVVSLRGVNFRFWSRLGC